MCFSVSEQHATINQIFSIITITLSLLPNISDSIRSTIGSQNYKYQLVSNQLAQVSLC